MSVVLGDEASAVVHVVVLITPHCICRVCSKGVLGVERLFAFLLKTWSEDIRHHQLASVLRGVGPMKSIEQFVHGIVDLFWLPIEQYRIDGRIVRGIQRGAQSFTTRTVLAALEITTRLIHILQVRGAVWGPLPLYCVL